MKVLNLYAGIGGNRKLWKDVEVHAIENNKTIAKIYQEFFPNDKVIVTDAHQYLLDHYKEFDFIWSSPPCPTHSRMNHLNDIQEKKKVLYPDMKLYEEIIFLMNWFKGKWVVENVIPYYDPLIKCQIAGRHAFWANFYIPGKKYEHDIKDVLKRKATMRAAGTRELKQLHGFNLDENVRGKRKILRNCVNPKIGLHVFECAFKNKQRTLFPRIAKSGKI